MYGCRYLVTSTTITAPPIKTEPPNDEKDKCESVIDKDAVIPKATESNPMKIESSVQTEPIENAKTSTDKKRNECQKIMTECCLAKG